MKIATNRLRTQRMLPEVYSDASRDFQVFTSLMDLTANMCDFDSRSILYVSDPRYIKSNFLTLLSDKIGVSREDAEILTDNEVRMILRCLPDLIKNKGTEKAIRHMVNLYFKIYHVSGDYTLSIKNGSAVVQDIQLQDHTVILGLETLSQSTKMLEIISKYILPPGYSFFVYFYSKLDRVSKDIHDDENITLLFRSSNLDSMVSQEIPDFIEYNSYLIGDTIDWYVPVTYVGNNEVTVYGVPELTTDVQVKLNGVEIIEGIDYTYDNTSQTVIFTQKPNYGDDILIKCAALSRTGQMISAVDASQLSDYSLNLSSDNFIGFHSHNYLTGSAQTPGTFAYNYTHPKTQDFVHGDIKIEGGEPKIYITEFPANIDKSELSEEYIEQHSYWKNLNCSQINQATIVISDDNVLNTVVDEFADDTNSTYKYKSVGEIYILVQGETIPEWKKLNFIGSYRDLSVVTSTNQYDYVCEIATEEPRLHRVISGEHSDITLTYHGFVHVSDPSEIPTIDQYGNEYAQYSLVYSVNNSTYYVYLYDDIHSWKPCIERATFTGQLPVNYQHFNDMTVYWIRGGKYKINNSATLTPNWVEYTEPIFLLKLLQRRGDV